MSGDAESARATTFVADNIGSYVGTGTESYAGATAKALLVSLSQGTHPQGLPRRRQPARAAQGAADHHRPVQGQVPVRRLLEHDHPVPGGCLPAQGRPVAGHQGGPVPGQRPVPQRRLPARPLGQPVLQQHQGRPGRDLVRRPGPALGEPDQRREDPDLARDPFPPTQQGADGGVKGAGPTNTENSNSTGLAVLAFSTTGHPERGHPGSAVPALAALHLRLPGPDARRDRV